MTSGTAQGAGTAAGPAYQATYRACMKEAAAQGRMLVQRMVGRAIEELQRRGKLAPDERERQVAVDAVKMLMKHEQLLCESFPQALLAEFAHALAGDTRKAMALSFDSLELMGDDQMRENVEHARLEQVVAGQVQGELAELNALMSAAQGLGNVQASRNPLRPEVYVRSLRTVVYQSPIPSYMRGRWMLVLGESLGKELARAYTELSSWLRAHGVAEASYTVSAPPTPGTPSAEAPAAPAGGDVLNLRELRKLLAGDFADSSKEGPRTQFAATMPAAVDMLENMGQVDAVVQRMKARQLADARALAEGRTPHREPQQVLAQEVVRLMMESIAGDKRLLAPVQACVRDLEPALMRLALDDPRFFSDRMHPARRLLDEFTQRSLAWDSPQSPGFDAFIEPLRQAVEVLRETRVPGAEPFDFALKTLEDAWDDEVRSGRQHREKAVRALMNAEQRNLLAEKLAKGLRTRPDLQAAPREIVAFVTGPWTQVIAQARLSDTGGSHDPGGYTAILTDLIWSSQPRVVGNQATRLLNLMPTLVDKVKQGLASIGYPQKSVDRFLGFLGHVHRASLRGAEITNSLPPRMSREDLEAMMGEGDTARGSWLAPAEAHESGFMQTVPDPAPQARGDETGQPGIPGLPELPLDHLQPGAWVEMLAGGTWQRMKVAWASPHGTLFMFMGRGGEPRSMSRRTLGQMLHAGTLRPVSGQALVEGALDEVAAQALRNSTHAPL